MIKQRDYMFKVLSEREGNYNGLEIEVDENSGVITVFGNNIAILATPFWEGKKGILLEELSGESIGTLNFCVSGDPKTDFDNYVSKISSFIL